MRIIEKKIAEIKPYERNPRKNEDAVTDVAASISEFGFKVPIIIDKNNIIVCGHTRYKAAISLHMEKVPCIIADDLTQDQINALRILDNKVAEKSEWDMELLSMELDEIDFDFEPFGLTDDKEQEGYFGDERERTFDAYNLNEIDPKRTVGKWGMPVLKSEKHIPKDLISFNYVLTSQKYEKGIHFYIDDYLFERIWNNPYTYIEKLAKFDCVLTPDFSLYTEMPLAMQIWNVFRSKLIGQMLQDAGLKVIPTLQWCREDSYDFAFDGIGKGGTVSVSTIGVKKDENATKLWKAGMDEAIKRIKPKNIVVYGGDIGYEFGNINVIFIENHNAEKIRGKEVQ